MENEFECIKIKDGLYLGNLQPAQDYQFLMINKFGYIVNCSAQTPNHFQTMGIKYLKFKLINNKPHKLFNQSLKKLSKIQKFISTCQQNSMCCLIMSQNNNTRSLVMIVAFLMNKFRWALRKTLEYVRSKGVYIFLTEHYIAQLQLLEQILNQKQQQPKLSQLWKGPYLTQQQQIITKTFLNSQEISIISQMQQNKQKKIKRVQWLDKLQKQQNKIQKQLKYKQSKQKYLQQKQRSSLNSINASKKPITNNFIHANNSSNSQISQKNNKSYKNEKKINQSHKSSSLNKISAHSDTSNSNLLSHPKLKKINTEEESINYQTIQQKQDKFIDQQHQINAQDNLMKLLKKNLKLSKVGQFEKNQSNNQSNQKNKLTLKRQMNQFNEFEQQQDQVEDIKKQPVYNLTINNFINPNIQILHQNKKKTQKNQTKSITKSFGDSQKQKSSKQNKHKKTGLNYSTKNVQTKKQRGKKKSQHSPTGQNSNLNIKQKIQKTISVQYKKSRI